MSPYTRYVYRVEAVNANGVSEHSGYVNVETPEAPAEPEDPPAPALPTGLRTAASESQVLLSWEDPGDGSIIGYRVLRRSRDGDEHGDGQQRVIAPLAGVAVVAGPLLGQAVARL